MPVRIQLRRTRGWRMPPNARKVDRATRWGNPFTAASAEERAAAVAAYARWIDAPEQAALLAQARAALRGFDLACWCPPGGPCHADVLLDRVNRGLQ